jgi:mono/diheme cytochrome c family protein
MLASARESKTLAYVVVTFVLSGVLGACHPAPHTQPAPASPLPTSSPTWVLGSLSRRAAPAHPSPLAERDTLGSRPSSQEAEEASPTPTPDPALVHRGALVFYGVGCFHCHGITAEGLVGPKIARTDLSAEAVANQVYQPVGDMPAFSDKAVPRGDVEAVYAFLTNLEPTGSRPTITATEPDSAAGAALYQFYGCYGCHGTQGEGVFGPRLAGTDLSLTQVRARVRTADERMPAYSPERLSDADMAHIYTFLQSLAQ